MSGLNQGTDMNFKVCVQGDQGGENYPWTRKPLPAMGRRGVQGVRTFLYPWYFKTGGGDGGK